jgi:hypothetical protein
MASTAISVQHNDLQAHIIDFCWMRACKYQADIALMLSASTMVL